MDIAVIGGDLRAAYLAQRLARRLDARAIALERADLPGMKCAPPEEIGSASYLVLNSPVQMKLTEERLELAEILRLARPEATLLFAGPRPAPDLAGAPFAVRDLTKDEAFLRANARLTAEGAIFAAMGRLPDSLADARCLVIGWGRIGRALTERLLGLGAAVTVASRGEGGRRQAQALGAAAVATERLTGVLGGADVVFSTAPALVLDEAALREARGDACIIDLASAPYGVDLAAAERLGLTAWREPGLPGRYCPRSAARALEDAVLKAVAGKGGRDNA